MRRVDSYFEYVTKAGDTWDMIALEQMGDESFMSELIQYNIEYADTLIFESGVMLLIPVFDDDDESEDATLPPWRSGDEGDSGTSSDDNNGEPYDYELGDSDENEEDDEESDES